jgi:hydroxysqualene synthase
LQRRVGTRRALSEWQAVSVDHYENFPVASLLCPPALRPAVVAIYRFARTADDIADEGTASAAARGAELQAYRAALRQALDTRSPTGAPEPLRWPQVFGPLREQARRFVLPPQPLHDLLDAFEQDAGNPVYANRAGVLDYCRRSANPIGRLLLHLYGIADAPALRQSDAICTALQLINFWQDLSVDLPRGRHYVCDEDLAAHGLSRSELQQQQDDERSRALVRNLCGWARASMDEGTPLVHRIGGRAGFELRLVVQGGLRILEKIETLDHAVLRRRPKLNGFDAPRLLVRAAGMKPRA